MKDKILNLLNLMNIKGWENVNIGVDTIDILGSISGKIVVSAIYVPNIKNRDLMDFPKLGHKSGLLLNNRVYFFDEKMIVNVQYFIMGGEIKEFDIKSLRKEIEQNIIDNLITKELNIPNENLTFFNSLIEQIDHSNYFKPDGQEDFIFSLYKDYLKALPFVKTGKGLNINIKSTTESSIYELDLRIDYKSPFYRHSDDYGRVSIAKFDFYCKFEYRDRSGLIYGNEIKFLYPDGVDYQILFSQLELYFGLGIMPNLVPLNRDLLKINIF